MASDELGLRAIVADAIDDTAAAFHTRHGFEPGADDQVTLMLPAAAVRAALLEATRVIVALGDEAARTVLGENLSADG